MHQPTPAVTQLSPHGPPAAQGQCSQLRWWRLCVLVCSCDIDVRLKGSEQNLQRRRKKGQAEETGLQASCVPPHTNSAADIEASLLNRALWSVVRWTRRFLNRIGALNMHNGCRSRRDPQSARCQAKLYSYIHFEERLCKPVLVTDSL